MANPMIEKYKHPVWFYLLATFIPWAFWFLAGYISHITPYSDHYLNIASATAFIGLLGPVVVSYWFIRKNAYLRADVYNRFFNFGSIKPIYIVLACGLMPASILLAQAISLLFGYSASQFVITGSFTFISGIFPVWFMLIIAPILEELGWHTYGTDCLRSRMNVFKTSLLFGLFWGIWHMPLAGIRDYYQSNIVEDSWIYGVNFLVSIIPFVLLMNWLYYKTGRNIILVTIFHITAGFFNEIFATHPDSKIIQTILLLLLTIFIVLNNRSFFFQKELTGLD
ncbi:MAG: CPBP family intramembrane metalloprotease [Gammaproteobacteria bacterium]|nr:CPBP family intramembrane metalloprotease [Gammaproteobacteria bacterium]